MTQVPSAGPVAPNAAPPDSTMAPHRGVLILVLGILSITCACFILGIVAWVMANKDLALMAAGRMDSSGRNVTKVGKICGIIGVPLSILQLVGLAIAIPAFIALMHSLQSGGSFH